jgi:hypothetical protein
VICTEYMARSVGSTFDAILPIAKAGARRSDQLGIRRRQDSNLLSVGVVGAPLRQESATGVVSRGAALRRNSVPAGGTGFDPAVDRQAVGGQATLCAAFFDCQIPTSNRRG